jgi:hypothetical protein
MRTPHARRDDGEPLKPGAEQAAEVGMIEGQQHVGRHEGTEENRPVLVHWEHSRLVDRQGIIHEIASIYRS